MKEMICIVCPRGCHLKVNDNNEVSGNFCPRGAKYAIEEITCPKRYITSTVRTVNLKENLLWFYRTPSLKRLYCFGCLNAWISSQMARLQFNESWLSGFAAKARI